MPASSLPPPNCAPVADAGALPLRLACARRRQARDPRRRATAQVLLRQDSAGRCGWRASLIAVTPEGADYLVPSISAPSTHLSSQRPTCPMTRRPSPINWSSRTTENGGSSDWILCPRSFRTRELSGDRRDRRLPRSLRLIDPAIAFFLNGSASAAKGLHHDFRRRSSTKPSISARSARTPPPP